jgi:hypothetical protein
LKVLINLIIVSDYILQTSSQVASAGAGPGADAPRRP